MNADWEVLIWGFYLKAVADHRIGTSHICLYFAILYETWKGFDEYLILDRISIMKKAKISSRVTYHRCLKALHDYGYVEYVASFSANKSKVKLIQLT